MEIRHQFISKKDFAVHESDIKVKSKCCGPDEGAYRRGRCYEALNLADFFESRTLFAANNFVIVYHIVDGAKNIAKGSEKVGNGKECDYTA